MDLANKEVTITRMGVNSIDRITQLQVAVTEELFDAETQESLGIKKNVGTFDLTLMKAYTGMNDPQLMLDINDKLAVIPE